MTRAKNYALIGKRKIVGFMNELPVQFNQNIENDRNLPRSELVELSKPKDHLAQFSKISTNMLGTAFPMKLCTEKFSRLWLVYQAFPSFFHLWSGCHSIKGVNYKNC
jgi:hypothetical protein